MHYRNGREAKNGDLVISLDGYGNAVINAVGVLHSVVPGTLGIGLEHIPKLSNHMSSDAKKPKLPAYG